MPELPSGTVTFLLTDVQRSTDLWERDPEAMRAALARHDALFEDAVLEGGGVPIRPRGEGDSRFAVFPSAPDAVGAALAIQRSFAAEPWPTPRPIKVRIGLHTGEAEHRHGDYYGTAVNRCARLRDIAHGGQVLMSEVTMLLARPGLPPEARLVDHGEHRLRDLTQSERVFQVTMPDLPADLSPPAALDARLHNLPIQPTALLGRAPEVAELRDLLLEGDARLVTLTGPGGTGKTRLSIQVAAELAERFEDGAFLVELGPIVDPALVPATIAQVLGVRDMGGRTMLDGLREHLRAKRLLLILDNFEQVLAAAPVVADLLAASPGLRVLATSREPLRVRGEREYAVTPLALPDVRQLPAPETLSQYAAIALFVERAAAIRADFAVTSENAPAVAEICSRLDGLPLAIELAAARVRLLTPQAIVGRLERRLPLLVGGPRDLPARQQTLRDAITWSYDLLNEAEQRLFRRLGGFAGGWTLEAVEGVGFRVFGDGGEPAVPPSLRTPHPAPVDVLDSLTAKSLVVQHELPDGETRSTMLETIRELAVEKLEAADEIDAVRRQHAGFFLAFAEQAESHLRTARQTTWLRRLDREHDNLRAALAWSRTADDGATGLRIAAALCWFWAIRGHVGEGRDWLAELLDLPGGTDRDRARALLAASCLAILQADHAAVRALAQRAAQIFTRLGDRAGGGLALTCVGIASLGEGNPPAARQTLEQGVAACREAGDRWGLTLALSQLASVFRQAGDLTTALALREEAAAIARALGDRCTLGLALMGAATVVRGQGDRHRSAALYREALAVLRDLEDLWLTPRAIDGLAGCASLDADYARAARLFGAAAGLREAGGTREMSMWRVEFERDLADVHAALGEATFAALWADGRAMSRPDAVEYALEERAGRAESVEAIRPSA
jgi:predicted ATPase/class 3 adenylate cyclase